MSSLRAIATRATHAAAFCAASSCTIATNGVLDRDPGLFRADDCDARLVKGRYRVFKSVGLIAERHAQDITKGCDLVYVRNVAQCINRFERAACDLHLHRGEISSLDDLHRRSLVEHGSVEDEREAVAAFCLVHVVCGDQYSRALCRQAMDLIPKAPSTDRIDAGGGLVKKEQWRLMDCRAGQGNSLLPASGESARDLFAAIAQPDSLDDGLDARFATRSGDSVDASVETGGSQAR